VRVSFPLWIFFPAGGPSFSDFLPFLDPSRGPYPLIHGGFLVVTLTISLLSTFFFEISLFSLVLELYPLFISFLFLLVRATCFFPSGTRGPSPFPGNSSPPPTVGASLRITLTAAPAIEHSTDRSGPSISAFHFVFFVPLIHIILLVTFFPLLF